MKHNHLPFILIPLVLFFLFSGKEDKKEIINDDKKEVEVYTENEPEDKIVLYHVDLYNFDECLVENSFLPLKENIDHIVELPTLRGYDRAGFDKAGFDKAGFNSYEEPNTFDFEESKNNTINLIISTNPNLLYDSKETTIETTCIKRYFNNQGYEEYQYPDNIVSMELRLEMNNYLLKVVSERK